MSFLGVDVISRHLIDPMTLTMDGRKDEENKLERITSIERVSPTVSISYL